MSKRLKINIVISGCLILVLLLAGFFYLPSILGDEMYTLKYEDLIVKYSVKYDVDPALVAAIIRQESNFNPNAVSRAGAKGLAQFMDGTAKTMAKQTGRWPNYDVFDPETSIEFCAGHIHDMLVKYSDNLDAALAAYNAGGGNADKWIHLGIMDNIPFGETRNYVKKVKNYYTIYLKLYGDNKLSSEKTKIETVKVEIKQADTYTAFWSMFFKDMFKIDINK